MSGGSLTEMRAEGGEYLVAERLETPRLSLRLPREPDWRGMHEHYSDALCTRYTLGRGLTEAESWRQTLVGADDHSGA